MACSERGGEVMSLYCVSLYIVILFYFLIACLLSSLPHRELNCLVSMAQMMSSCNDESAVVTTVFNARTDLGKLTKYDPKCCNASCTSESLLLHTWSAKPIRDASSDVTFVLVANSFNASFLPTIFVNLVPPPQPVDAPNLA